MNTNKKTIATTALLAAAALGLAGCTAAETSSYNLSASAENFELNRNIKVINGITDTVILEVEGFCSVETSAGSLQGAMEITCRLGPDEYKKSFVYLSDNVTASVEQIDSKDVDPYHYRYIVRPEALLPTVELDAGKN